MSLSQDYPLEPDPRLARGLAEACLEFFLAQQSDVEEQPSHGLDDARQLAALLREEQPPENGCPLASLLDTLGEAVPRSINTISPGYLAYVPGGGLLTSALADLLACGVNRYVGMGGAAPALAQLERNVIDWFCRWLDYPVQAAGVLTSGGSMANLSAVVTARVDKLGDDLARGTYYTTDQVHYSVTKAAHLAGLPRRNLRLVATDRNYRLDLHELARAVAQDRQDGLKPFLVVGNAGSTNTGAVDPWDRLADFAEKEGLWLHADGAYGGFFYLTDQGRQILRGLPRADSITLDPHKSLFLPYGTGCLLVRDGHKLRSAHSASGVYLQDICRYEDHNFSDHSPEQSRDFRGLRVWLPLKLHGVTLFREALEEKLDLARQAHLSLSQSPGFEILAPPQLSALAFRYLPRQGDVDDFNLRLVDAVNQEKRVFLSSTTLPYPAEPLEGSRGSVVALRLCILGYRTHRRHVESAVESLIRLAGNLESRT